MAEHPLGSILVAASGFVYGPTASNNLGDRAQLTCTVERLRLAFPGWRLVAVANSLNDVADLDELEVSYSAVRYLTSPVTIPVIGGRLAPQCGRLVRTLLLVANARRITRDREPLLLSEAGRAALDEMQESSALFLSGAGTFNDLYALGVGGFWAVLVQSMSRLGKPVVASGQQVGPLARRSRRIVAGLALRRIDLLGVRDPRSVAVARAVGVPDHRIVLTGDDAWDLQPAPSDAVIRLLEREGIKGPFIAAQVRFGPSVGWVETDASILAAALAELSEYLGMPLVFVPCMTGTKSDDRTAAACVQEHLTVPNRLLAGLDVHMTKAVIGRAFAAVGTANHFCIFAASSGVPAIGLYATPYMEQKLAGIAELWPTRVRTISKPRVADRQSLAQLLAHLLSSPISRDESDPNRHLDQSSTIPTAFLATILRR